MKCKLIFFLVPICYGYKNKPFRLPVYNNVVKDVVTNFPGAIREDHFIEQLYDVLHSYSESFGTNTLLATSFCCDEINREFEMKLGSVFGGSYFSLGGLAGFPFGGTTGFVAFSHHIPKCGSSIIIFGPHVGVDNSGNIGKISRRGISSSNNCCGSAYAAFKNGVNCNTLESDLEQNAVALALYKSNRMKRVLEAKNPGVELPHVLFEAQHEMIEKIIRKSAHNNIPENTYIAVIGGIHINTPSTTSDFFLPLVFKIYNSTGCVVNDFIRQ